MLRGAANVLRWAVDVETLLWIMSGVLYRKSLFLCVCRLTLSSRVAGEHHDHHWLLSCLIPRCEAPDGSGDTLTTTYHGITHTAR